MANNSVIFIGAFARDPELRFTPNGTAIFEGTIAGEDRIIKQDGKEANIPWYHRFTLMGKSAEYAANQNYVAGHIARIAGQIDHSQWTDNESGKKRSAIKIKVSQMMGIQRLQDRPDMLVHDSGGGVRLSADGGALNQVAISGNLTKDVELRHTTAGDAVASLRIAVNETWRDRDNKKETKTHYIDVEVWREAAEMAAHYKKGQGIFAMGRLENRSFTDKNGNKGSSTQISPIICEPAVGTVQNKDDNQSQEQNRQPAQANRQNQAPMRTQPSATPSANRPAANRPAPTRSGGLDIDTGLDDFPPEEEDLPF